MGVVAAAGAAAAAPGGRLLRARTQVAQHVVPPLQQVPHLLIVQVRRELRRCARRSFGAPALVQAVAHGKHASFCCTHLVTHREGIEEPEPQVCARSHAAHCWDKGQAIH